LNPGAVATSTSSCYELLGALHEPISGFPSTMCMYW
jgi:hypothetical protein